MKLAKSVQSLDKVCRAMPPAKVNYLDHIVRFSPASYPAPILPLFIFHCHPTRFDQQCVVNVHVAGNAMMRWTALVSFIQMAAIIFIFVIVKKRPSMSLSLIIYYPCISVLLTETAT